MSDHNHLEIILTVESTLLLNYFTLQDANTLRLVNKEIFRFVLTHQWVDSIDLPNFPTFCSIKRKKCFPHERPRLFTLTPLLQQLDISNSNTITLPTLPNLFVLKAINCQKFTGEMLAYTCPRLKSLNINECSAFTNDALCQIGKKTRLWTLSIANCLQITGTTIATFKHLRYLCVSRCAHLKRNAFINCDDLEILDISHCTYLTFLIFIHMPKIHTLNASNCYYLTNEMFDYIPNVHTLDISYCARITKLRKADYSPGIYFTKINIIVPPNTWDKIWQTLSFSDSIKIMLSGQKNLDKIYIYSDLLMQFRKITFNISSMTSALFTSVGKNNFVISNIYCNI